MKELYWIRVANVCNDVIIMEQNSKVTTIAIQRMDGMSY